VCKYIKAESSYMRALCLCTYTHTHTPIESYMRAPVCPTPPRSTAVTATETLEKHVFIYILYQSSTGVTGTEMLGKPDTLAAAVDERGMRVDEGGGMGGCHALRGAGLLKACGGGVCVFVCLSIAVWQLLETR
jgi:hypothetical protein